MLDINIFNQKTWWFQGLRKYIFFSYLGGSGHHLKVFFSQQIQLIIVKPMTLLKAFCVSL